MAVARARSRSEGDMRTRIVEFEGGPWDGERKEIDARAYTVEVAMPPRVYVVQPSHKPSRIRRGLYVQDPLDHATFVWKGE